MKVISVDNGRLFGQEAQIFIENWVREHGSYPPVEYVEVEEIDGEETIIVDLDKQRPKTTYQKKVERAINEANKMR